VKVNRWILPEGVEELLPEQASRVESLRRSLLDEFATWGYQLVMPPFVEFAESLLLDENPELNVQTFKVVDRTSGKTLGVRADITPQIARINAHSMDVSGVNRLCYAGSVLHSTPKSPLASRSPIQVGCELFGNSDVTADIEVISLMISTLKVAGVQNITLDLGHVAIISTLLDSTEANELEREQICVALAKKSIDELKSALEGLAINAKLRAAIVSAASIVGGRESTARLKEALLGLSPTIDQALDELSYVQKVIAERFVDVELFIDVTQMRGFGYHTGIVYSALTPSIGEPLAVGGRYDALSERFGRACPSTGFNCNLKALLAFVEQIAPQDNRVFLPVEHSRAAWHFVVELRSQGWEVIEGTKDSSPSEEQYRCSHIVCKCGTEWKLSAV